MCECICACFCLHLSVRYNERLIFCCFFVLHFFGSIVVRWLWVLKYCRFALMHPLLVCNTSDQLCHTRSFVRLLVVAAEWVWCVLYEMPLLLFCCHWCYYWYALKTSVVCKIVRFPLNELYYTYVYRIGYTYRYKTFGCFFANKYCIFSILYQLCFALHLCVCFQWFFSITFSSSLNDSLKSILVSNGREEQRTERQKWNFKNDDNSTSKKTRRTKCVHKQSNEKLFIFVLMSLFRIIRGNKIVENDAMHIEL